MKKTRSRPWGHNRKMWLPLWGLIWLCLTLCACGQAGTQTTLPDVTESIPSAADISREDTPAASPLPSETSSAGEDSQGVLTSPAESTEESAPGTTSAGSGKTRPSREPRESTPKAPEPEETTVPGDEEAGDILSGKVPDYSRQENWAYLEWGAGQHPVDVFFLCPTVVDHGRFLHLSDTAAKQVFISSIDREKPLYDGSAVFYAPFYRQMAEEVYTFPRQEQQFWRDQALRDAAAAFRYYLDHFNQGRPFLLAGFSQGAEVCIRLVQQFFDPSTAEGEALTQQLVAVYAIGAGLPQSLVEECPWLRPAQEERDTGVIISFDCEFAGVTDSVLLPAGSRSLSINPLSWRSDGTPAPAALNKGACFLGPNGVIFSEVPGLCGCYIEPDRGALVVTDIRPEHYPADTTVLPPGNLHEYDYLFFYRNIQENIRTRIAAYLENH